MHSFFFFWCMCVRERERERERKGRKEKEMRALSCIEKKTTALGSMTKGFLLYSPFLLTDRLSSEVNLGNLFLALLCPFSTTDNGISTNICETEVFFNFILPPIPKDIYLLKEISIFKEGSTDRVEPVTDDISDTIDLAQKH